MDKRLIISKVLMFLKNINIETVKTHLIKIIDFQYKAIKFLDLLMSETLRSSIRN